MSGLLSISAVVTAREKASWTMNGDDGLCFSDRLRWNSRGGKAQPPRRGDKFSREAAKECSRRSEPWVQKSD